MDVRLSISLQHGKNETTKPIVNDRPSFCESERKEEVLKTWWKGRERERKNDSVEKRRGTESTRSRPFLVIYGSELP